MITILQHSQYYVSFFVHLKNDTFFNFVYKKKFKKSGYKNVCTCIIVHEYVDVFYSGCFFA